MKRHNPDKPFRMGLKAKLIITIIFLLSAMLLTMGIVTNRMVSDILEEQISKRALSVAKSVALMPQIRDAFAHHDPASIIQPIVEPMRLATGAEFIVIGNTETVRYSHPVPERIGQKMVGGDNDQALIDGEFYASKAIGTLGPSLRGKGPILSDTGEIIGIVSVGFLIDDIETIIGKYEKELWLLVVFFIGIGALGATIISNNFKKLILGLEPEEITRMFLQKEAILQSIYEGIIAINQDARITMINNKAQRLVFDERKKMEDYIGKHILEVFPMSRMVDVLKTGKSHYNQEAIIGHNVCIVNRVPIFHKDQVIGVVATFRDKSEIDRLTQELHRIKLYSEALRAQTHEFSNKLHTISGLIQLDKSKEAIDLINKEQAIQQGWIDMLTHKIQEPMISAILLGKLNRANELGVKLEIDPDSNLSYAASDAEREALITILGNLLENSLEAALENKEIQPPLVKVAITDIGNDFIIDIEDSGKGIHPKIFKKLFDDGFSTKDGKHRGIGLALVQQATKELNGSITLEQGELGGACITVFIPKSKKGVKSLGK